MKSLKSLSLLLLGAIIFISCEKENNVNPSINSNDSPAEIGVQDGKDNSKSSKTQSITWHWGGDIRYDCLPFGHNCPVVTPSSAIAAAMDNAIATDDYNNLFTNYSSELSDVDSDLKDGLLANELKMYPIDDLSGDDLTHYRIGELGLQ